MEFNELKDAIQSATDTKKARIDVLASQENLPVAVFGYGNIGKRIIKQLGRILNKVYVYDLNPLSLDRAASDGFEVVRDPKDLAEFQVILGSGQNQVEQKQTIDRNYLFYEEATYLYNLMHVQSSARKMSDIILQEIEKFYWVYNILQDESKDAFLDVLLFRASLNPDCLKKTRVNNKLMWLDIPTKFRSRDYKNFLDVGAFDGDTIESVREKLNIDRVHAIEANIEFIPQIARQAKNFANGLAIYPYAAWSSNRMLSFIEDQNGMFNIVESDKGNICAATLDSLINEKVDLIKMDIEGSELQALSGSKNLLSSAPDMLMAAYHRPLDFVEISSRLLKQNSDYRVYFRHYSDVYDDSILYFLT